MHYFLTWIYGFFYSFESNSFKANTSWELRAEFDFVTWVLLGRFDRLVANICCLIFITDLPVICIAEIARKFFSLQKKKIMFNSDSNYGGLRPNIMVTSVILKEFKLLSLCGQRDITFCNKNFCLLKFFFSISWTRSHNLNYTY